MNTSKKSNTGKPDVKRMQVTQQIFHNLLEIAELYPQYSLSQHLATITRAKGGKELFHWKDEDLLKRIEQHKAELEGDEMMNIPQGEDEY